MNIHGVIGVNHNVTKTSQRNQSIYTDNNVNTGLNIGRELTAKLISRINHHYTDQVLEYHKQEGYGV